ncbi:hypothetical protein C2S52_012938 [Perilla frutescens var. hirtella]|nr:hypothetical protein C2S51_015294 [Perilla frutescens var. frutescens]KAH6775377.1 hypothetical protein C2S52_012938 [Perilla frutescens var. hirtella]
MAFPSNEVESTQDLLDAQSHVWNHIFHHINSMSLKCAIQLGIPDVIHKHGNPMTVSQLTNALPINKAKSPCLHRLIRILVHSKFLDKVKTTLSEDEDEEEAYCLTRASRLLLRCEPMSMAPFALAMFDSVKMDPWHHMSEWFQNEDSSPFFTKHGMTIFEYAGNDQRLNGLFNEAMASDAGFVTSVLSKECRHVFEGLKSMVDVGGGTGATAKGIAAAFPGLKCIVLDLPHVVADLEGSENLSFFSGDMFEFIPPADAVFLKWLLHDWSDEDCIKILRKCKEAISPGGKVIIVEIVVGDQKQDNRATETQFFFDLQVMVQINGRERSEKDWANLFSTAGFKNYKITHVLGLRSVIEVFP